MYFEEEIKVNIVTVLDVDFKFGGMINTIFPVILSDDSNMILKGNTLL